LGRGLRTAEGKRELIILDHSDSTLRLGFVTDIHHTRLDGGSALVGEREKVEPTPPKPAECVKCQLVYARHLSACPGCGHAPERVCKVETVGGELIDMTAAQRKANGAEWAEKIAFMAQLKAYANSTGKREGWVAHKYRQKFGVWPYDFRVKHCRPAAGVDPHVRSWIMAQNIRWAKSQARRANG
jgi:hypothetical protein